MFSLSESSKKHREGVHPELVQISDLAIQRCPIDFGHGPYSGRRLAADQWFLFTQDLSDCDGYGDLSLHQTGDALDFYAYVDGRASWKPAHLAIVGATFLQCAVVLGFELEWGGLWPSRSGEAVDGIPYGWDMSHVQRVITK